MARLHGFALRRVTTSHTVVAAHDRDLAAAAEFVREFGGRAFDVADEMLAETRPDIVHVCTPAGTHFEPARAAIEAGANVYVEKPFQDTASQAVRLLDLAASQGVKVCAGHQQLRDAAYERLIDGAATLGRPLHVESRFTFAAPFDPDVAPPARVAQQLLDIMPHPLYTLLHAMERVSDGGRTTLEHVTADHAQVHALVRRGTVSGVLLVSLRARPIVSSLSITGTEGSVTADFVRSVLVGSGNPGTSPVEKILNPIVEGLQLQWRSLRSLARRLLSGGHYPGLAELLEAFYGAVAVGRPSPLSAEHLIDVSRLLEQLSQAVSAALPAPTRAVSRLASGPVAMVTGAGGFFGRRIADALTARGYRVRGVSRAPDTRLASVHDWVAADLSRGVPSVALANVEVVVHAAAATSGGLNAHQRHSVDATRHVVQAMAAAGVRRLVYISSMSVLEPPHTPWEVQDEHTPLAANAARLGPYAWGKAEAERVVTELSATLGLEVRILRPAALLDLSAPEIPGLLGRRLYGRWHLGLGRPGLPFALCDVARAAEVVGWYASHFNEAPPVVNLWDPAYPKRRDAVRACREAGWNGRVVWVPIRALGIAAQCARYAMALLRGGLPSRLSIIGVLKPRRFDAGVSRDVLERAAAEREAAMMRHDLTEPSPVAAGSTPGLSRAR